jgi:superfamily II DNA or RNA helicase
MGAGMTLRPYQQEAKDAIFREWDQGHSKTLLVLPTGTGKTIVFSAVAEECVRAGSRVLILAHRGELLDQAQDKLLKATGLRCSVEKAEETSLHSWYRVTVGSVQTLMREKRLAQFLPSHFSHIIIDEAHHCLSDSYQRVLEHFSAARVLGVTATPDRGDMRNLGQYFESLAYEYTLPKAIREGYLCPIKAQTIPLKLDLTGVGVQNGDFQARDLGTALDPYLYQIADEMANYCKGRKTVVFLPLVKTSQKFRDILNSRGFRAAEVNGESQDRAEILQDFAAGAYDVLCNSMLLTEGWDCPSVDCIVVLRPTKVRSLYSQMVGRGTRLCEGKDHLLLLDFLWHTERHELCHPASLICETAEVAQKATENIEEAGGPVDLIEAEEQAATDVVAQREEALAKALAEMKSRKRKLVDPLQFEMSIQAEDLSGYVPSFGWEMGPPSDKQRATLERLGIFPDEIDNAGKAALLLDRLSKRREEGLTTPKQIRFLEGKGFEHVGTWSFEAARRLIDRIAANSWRVPYDINPKTYIPPKGADNAWSNPAMI